MAMRDSEGNGCELRSELLIGGDGKRAATGRLGKDAQDPAWVRVVVLRQSIPAAGMVCGPRLPALRPTSSTRTISISHAGKRCKPGGNDRLAAAGPVARVAAARHAAGASRPRLPYRPGLARAGSPFFAVAAIVIRLKTRTAVTDRRQHLPRTGLRAGGV